MIVCTTRNSSNAMADTEAPASFFCSISFELMRDPVSTADGHTYEREAIEQWFAAGHDTSPSTGASLPHTQLAPNIALRQAIEQLAPVPEAGAARRKQAAIQRGRCSADGNRWAELRGGYIRAGR